MPFDERYRPDPVFMQLDEGFHDPVEPAEFPRRTPRFFNEPWAARVGLGGLDAPERERHFARLQPLPDNLPQPLALRYHGHQFGSYNPRAASSNSLEILGCASKLGPHPRCRAPCPRLGGRA